jgi:hypothetical protein
MKKERPVQYISVIPHLIIVVAAVVGSSNNAGPLLGVCANEVDLRVVEDLVVLVGRQLVHVQFHHLAWQAPCIYEGSG